MKRIILLMTFGLLMVLINGNAFANNKTDCNINVHCKPIIQNCTKWAIKDIDIIDYYSPSDFGASISVHKILEPDCEIKSTNYSGELGGDTTAKDDDRWVWKDGTYYDISFTLANEETGKEYNVERKDLHYTFSSPMVTSNWTNDNSTPNQAVDGSITFHYNDDDVLCMKFDIGYSGDDHDVTFSSVPSNPNYKKIHSFACNSNDSDNIFGTYVNNFIPVNPDFDNTFFLGPSDSIEGHFRNYPNNLTFSRLSIGYYKLAVAGFYGIPKKPVLNIADLPGAYAFFGTDILLPDDYPEFTNVNDYDIKLRKLDSSDNNVLMCVYSGINNRADCGFYDIEQKKFSKISLIPLIKGVHNPKIDFNANGDFVIAYNCRKEVGSEIWLISGKIIYQNGQYSIDWYQNRPFSSGHENTLDSVAIDNDGNVAIGWHYNGTAFFINGEFNDIYNITKWPRSQHSWYKYGFVYLYQGKPQLYPTPFSPEV